jgi:hypothetical protein
MWGPAVIGPDDARDYAAISNPTGSVARGAEIARIYAEDIRDPEARRQMLDIALGYDRLPNSRN